MKIFAALITVVALSACAGPMNDADTDTATGATPPTVGGDGAPDQCRAATYQNLVGLNRSQVPTPAPAGETWRVTCTTCPVTMDFNPRRLNILYDQATGVVREVRCG